MAASFFALRISHLAHVIGAAHANLFGGVSSSSAARASVRLMTRDGFYFLLALAALAIVTGWMLFLTFAE